MRSSSGTSTALRRTFCRSTRNRSILKSCNPSTLAAFDHGSFASKSRVRWLSLLSSVARKATAAYAKRPTTGCSCWMRCPDPRDPNKPNRADKRKALSAVGPGPLPCLTVVCNLVCAGTGATPSLFAGNAFAQRRIDRAADDLVARLRHMAIVEEYLLPARIECAGKIDRGDPLHARALRRAPQGRVAGRVHLAQFGRIKPTVLGERLFVGGKARHGIDGRLDEVKEPRAARRRKAGRLDDCAIVTLFERRQLARRQVDLAAGRLRGIDEAAHERGAGAETGIERKSDPLRQREACQGLAVLLDHVAGRVLIVERLHDVVHAVVKNDDVAGANGRHGAQPEQLMPDAHRGGAQVLHRDRHQLFRL